MRRSLTLLLLLLFANILFAQVNHLGKYPFKFWKGSLSDYCNGSTVCSIVNDTLFQAVENKWVALGPYNTASNPVSNIYVDEKNNIWIINATNLNYTIDLGKTWTTISTPTGDVRYIASIIVRGDSVYLKKSSGYYRKNFKTNSDWQTISVGRSSGDYAATFEDWTTTKSGIHYRCLYNLSIEKSTDDGLTWQNTGWNRNVDSSTPCAIISMNNRLYVGSYWGGVHFSDDGGNTWSKSNGLPAGRGVDNIIANSKYIICLVDDQISTTGYYISTDNGLNFKPLTNNALNFWGQQELSFVTMDGSGNIFINAGNRGFLKSVDGGLNWTDYNNGNNNAYPHHVTKLDIDNYGNLYALLSNGDSYMPNYGAYGLLISNDGGVTWHRDIDLKDNYQNLNDMSVTNNGNVYVIGYNTGLLYRSTNFGSNFSDIKFNYNSTNHRIFLDRTNEEKIFVTTQMYNTYKLSTASNSGDQVVSNSASDILFSSKYIYGAFESEIKRSADGGTTWISISTQTLSQLVENPSTNTLYGYKDKNIYKSIDEGISWSNMTNINGNPQINRILLTNDGNIVAATSSGLFTYNQTTNIWNILTDNIYTSVIWDKLNERVIASSGFGIDEIKIPCTNYKLASVTTNPSNGGTITGGGLIAKNQSCTLKAVPNSGTLFLYWTENGKIVSTDQEYTYTVSSNRVLVANFTGSSSYTLTTTSNIKDAGTISGSGVFLSVAECTVTAIPANGYAFTNWTDDKGNIVSTSSSYTFKITQNTNLIANYSLAPNVSIIQPTDANFYGSISVHPSNGYTYSINGTDYQDSNIFTNLPIGTYSLTLKDNMNNVSKPILAVINSSNVVSAQNYKIKNTNVTCKGNMDGIINVSVEKSLNYSVTVTGNNYSKTDQLTDKTYTLSNLSADIYNVCFTINGLANYRQCFTVAITEPQDLSVLSSMLDANKVHYDLQGGVDYYITVNGKSVKVQNDNVEIVLNPGINKVRITTDKLCQGVYEKELFINEDNRITLSSNPVNREVFIGIPGKDEVVNVLISSLNGIQLLNNNISVGEDRLINIDISKLTNGIYILEVSGQAIHDTVKLIKN